ncbi:MAG: glycosyltransferase family 39 protein [Tepidisphaeraceae bacterium]|jgi:uncharacterized membrane protein
MLLSPSPQMLSKAGLKWIHLLLLVTLLAAGAAVRFYRLGEASLWLDEYWSVYISTAHAQAGTSVFDAPRGVVLDPPPSTGFADAPPWWRIWTGMSSAVHPPLYHIVLRWWIDLFGDGDFSTRSLSTLLDLAGAVLLFVMVRPGHGPWPALAAAALMLFSMAQIDLSRETRSYTLLVLLGLVCCRTVAMIERHGASWGRLALLSVASAAMALTHYFAAGFLSGLVVYTLLRLRGQRRIAALAAIFLAGVWVALTWGPFFWSARGLVEHASRYPAPGAAPAEIVDPLLALPARLTLSPFDVTWLTTLPLAILTFVIPLIGPRRTSDAWLWWCWVIGGIALVAAFDLARQTLMVGTYKFLLPAGPGVYALLATQPSLSGLRARLRAPLLVFLCAGAAWAIVETLADWQRVLPADRSWLIVIPLILLLFTARWRSSWPLWVLAAACLTLAVHISSLPATMFSYPRLLLIAGPVVFLLLAATLPARPCNWFVPLSIGAVVLWSVVVSGQRVAPGFSVIAKPDWRTAARLIDQRAGPKDVIAFGPCAEAGPAFGYIVYKHYLPDSRRPTIFLGETAPDSAVLRQLAARPAVWVVGGDADADTRRFFPGWRHGPLVHLPPHCNLWPIYPP